MLVFELPFSRPLARLMRTDDFLKPRKTYFESSAENRVATYILVYSVGLKTFNIQRKVPQNPKLPKQQNKLPWCMNIQSLSTLYEPIL